MRSDFSRHFFLFSTTFIHTREKELLFPQNFIPKARAKVYALRALRTGNTKK